MSDEHTHAWLDEREPDDRPSLWDERDLDVEYNPEPPEDREPDDDDGADETDTAEDPSGDDLAGAEPVKTDWQGYRVNVPRDEQCRRTLPGRRVFCEREKGHTGNHKSGPTQWGSMA